VIGSVLNSKLAQFTCRYFATIAYLSIQKHETLQAYTFPFRLSSTAGWHWSSTISLDFRPTSYCDKCMLVSWKRDSMCTMPITLPINSQPIDREHSYKETCYIYNLQLILVSTHNIIGSKPESKMTCPIIDTLLWSGYEPHACGIHLLGPSWICNSSCLGSREK